MKHIELKKKNHPYPTPPPKKKKEKKKLTRIYAGEFCVICFTIYLIYM